MGFSFEFKNGIVTFILKGTVSLDEIVEILAIINKLFDKKKPFVFIVDTRPSTGIPPMSAGITIVKWMIKSRQKIIETLDASAIVFKDPKVSALLKWVFTKQKPAKPNFVTTDIDKAIKFVKEKHTRP